MKKIVKSLLCLSSLSIIGGAISPFLISCANNTSNSIDYNQTNNSIEMNSSNIEIFHNQNIFSVFSNIISFQNDSNDLVSKKYVEKMTQELLEVINNWLIQNDYNKLSIIFDLSNIIVANDWSLLIPITSSKPLNNNSVNKNLDVKQVKINFPRIDVSQIKKSASENIYTQSALSTFPNKTLEQIKELPQKDILKVLSNILPSKTIIWNFPIEGIEPFEIVYNNETKQQILKILILIPGEHFGTLELYYSEDEIKSPGPSKTLIDEFGKNLNSYWPTFAQIQMESLEQMNFSKVNSGISNQILPTYEDVLVTKNIQNQITTYKQKYATNFEQDLIFYLKNYFANLSIEWDNKNLLLSDIFVTKTVNIDKATGKLNAKLGIDIHNNSVGTRRLKLPITNEIVTIEKNDVITIIIDWNNSDIQPFLNQIENKNSAYLTTSFNNMNIKFFKHSNLKNNRFLAYSSSWYNSSTSNFQNLFPVSYSLKKIVDNVGFGNTILDSNDLIKESFNALKMQDLKNAKLNAINREYEQFLDILKSIQGIALKSATNPTLYNFLQSINSEIYDVMYLLSSDERVASIISDIFSVKKLSEYLHSNIGNIISLLKDVKNSSDTSMDIVIEMLTMIESTNPTLEEKQEWVKSIEGLYPTLEKLLGSNLQWIMPLIKSIMTSISADDPSVIQLLFNNTDFVLQFMQLPENKDKLGITTVELIKLISQYLNELIIFGQEMSRDINSNPNKYKTIKVLDILTYELTEKNVNQISLFNIIIEILKLVNPNSITINTLQQIQGIIGNQISLPKILNDYSKSTFQNETNWLGIKNYKVVKDTITKTKLSTQLGKLINSIFNVYINNSQTTIDLYSMFVINMNIEIEKHNFLWNTNKKVTQELNIKFSFKQDIKIDLIPLCVIIDNLIIKSNSKNKKIISNDQLKIVKPNKIFGIESSLLPVNLVIKKDVNYYKTSFVSKEESIFPTISNKGQINWSYNSQQNNIIEFKQIINDSNELVNKDNKTKNYYGSKYSTFKLILNSFKFNNIWSKFTETTTNLINPVIIKNYDSKIHISQAYVSTKNKSNKEISDFLATYINNYGQWTKSTWDENRNQFSFKDNSDFVNELKQYLNFSPLFNENIYTKYNIGFDSIHYEFSLLSLIKIETYQYSLVIKFNIPILYTTIENGIKTTNITNELRFTVKSNKQPTPIMSFKN